MFSDRTQDKSARPDASVSFSAEALQVGPVGSAMGLGGIWTVAVHEEGEEGLSFPVLPMLNDLRSSSWRPSRPVLDVEMHGQHSGTSRPCNIMNTREAQVPVS